MELLATQLDLECRRYDLVGIGHGGTRRQRLKLAHHLFEIHTQQSRLQGLHNVQRHTKDDFHALEQENVKDAHHERLWKQRTELWEAVVDKPWETCRIAWSTSETHTRSTTDCVRPDAFLIGASVGATSS